MRKKIAVLVFLSFMLFSSGSAQIQLGSVNHNLDPLEPGKTHELNVSVSNERSVPQSAKFILEAGTSINTSYEGSILDVSGELIGPDSENFNNCDFSYKNAWVYTCPGSDGLKLSANSENNLTLQIKPPLNIRGGSDILEINLSAEAWRGKEDKSVSLNGDNLEKSIDDFDFNISGTGVSGEISTAESFVFSEPSSNELLGRFSTSISGHDSVNMKYYFSDSLIKHYDYSFRLYNYSDGSWEEINTELNQNENTVSADISGSGFYSLYIDREKLSIQDLVDRETNVTTSVNGSSANVKLEKLGATENVTAPVPTIRARNGVKLSGFEFTSNVNDTAEFDAKMLDELPAGIPDINEEDYEPVGYTEVEAVPESSLTFRRYTFRVNNTLFNYSENINSHRYTGSSWEEMDTRFISGGGIFDSFEAITNGNSVLAFGRYNPNIKIESISHRDNLLDNETLEVQVNLTNKWEGTGEKYLNFSLNGTQKEKTVEVQGESKESVRFKHSDLQPGNYTFTVNNESSSFSVELRPIQYRLVDMLPINTVKSLYMIIAGILSLPFMVLVYREIPRISSSLTRLRLRMRSILPKRVCVGPPIEDIEETEEQVNDDKEEIEDNSDLDTEDADGDFMCAICGEAFETSTGLMLHHRKFHEE